MGTQNLGRMTAAQCAFNFPCGQSVLWTQQIDASSLLVGIRVAFRAYSLNLGSALSIQADAPR